MTKNLFAILLTVAIVALCGCGKSYSESDIESARQQAYDEGFDDGYDRGAEDQREMDCEEFLVDGHSLRDIVDEVYNEFGITPSEAFYITEDYNYAPNRGGYTWDEYQKAIEIMYYTLSIIPSD